MESLLYKDCERTLIQITVRHTKLCCLITSTLRSCTNLFPSLCHSHHKVLVNFSSSKGHFEVHIQGGEGCSVVK